MEGFENKNSVSTDGQQAESAEQIKPYFEPRAEWGPEIQDLFMRLNKLDEDYEAFLDEDPSLWDSYYAIYEGFRTDLPDFEPYALSELRRLVEYLESRYLTGLS